MHMRTNIARSSRRGALRSRIAIVLAAVVLAGGYWVCRASDDPNAIGPASKSAMGRADALVSGGATEIGLAPTSNAVEPRQVAQASSSDELAVLRVVDADGHAIADAVAAVCAPGTRELDPHDPTNLGTSDASGIIRVPFSRLREHSAATISVLHREYAAASVSSDALLDGEERVVLWLGLACLVRCVDLDHLPLAGVLIRVSSETFEGSTSLPAGLPTIPGSDVGKRIHSAISDSHGIARLTGLALQTYGISAYLESYTLVQGVEDDGAFTAPTDEIETVRLAPILGFVGRYEGDEVLSSSLQMSGQFSSVGGTVDELVRREKIRLEARFPDALVLTAQSMSLEKPKPWRLHVLFARHPAETFELQPVPVAEIEAPQVLRPTGESFGELPSAELVLVDASGKSVDPSGLFVELGQPPRSFMVDVAAHQSIRLPAGEYPLKTHDPFLRGCLPPSTLRVPGKTLVTLDRDFRECRLTFPDSGATRALTGHIECTVAHFESISMFALDTSRAVELWLPVGSVSIEFGVADAESTSREFQVVASTGAELQELVLR
jgi:hypothetical protein